MASTIPYTHARSWLLVSASRPDLFGPAVDGPADAVLLDLEDGVVPSAKDAARESVVAFLSDGDTSGRKRRGWVRINDTSTPYWADDLAALDGLPGLSGIMLAKSESGHQVDETAKLLHGDVPIIPLIESARGIEFAFDIASADSVVRLAFGSGDFRRDTGAGADAAALAYARGRLVVAAGATGTSGPIDGPTPSTDSSVLSADLSTARTMGLTGKLCLRATQCPDINRAFSPAEDDIAWATNVIAVLGINGEHVRDGSDLPRLARTRRIRALADVFGDDHADHYGSSSENPPSG